MKINRENTLNVYGRYFFIEILLTTKKGLFGCHKRLVLKKRTCRPPWIQPWQRPCHQKTANFLGVLNCHMTVWEAKMTISESDLNIFGHFAVWMLSQRHPQFTTDGDCVYDWIVHVLCISGFFMEINMLWMIKRSSKLKKVNRTWWKFNRKQFSLSFMHQMFSRCTKQMRDLQQYQCHRQNQSP